MLNKLRLLTPGPTPLPEEVRLALARDMIHHRKKDFGKLMAAVQEQLRILFGTDGPVLPLACSGSGAMTAAVYSLFAPGEKVLVIEGGKFGQRWRQIAESRGLVAACLPVPFGKGVDPGKVAAILDEDPSIAGVLVQACETSTGVMHPVDEIARRTVGRKALLVVDGVSAVGISPCPMDELCLDCLFTGSQKGLMLPPGLSLLALSPRAWKKAEATAPGCFYFNLPKELEKLEKNQTNFTTPVNLIFGLKASLDLLLAEGIEKVYAKQWALTMLARQGAQSLGLELFAPENFAWGLTSILLPAGVDGVKLLALAESEYGVCMAGGQDDLKGRLVRLGHMGWVDWSDVLAGLYAIKAALSGIGGYSASRDFMEAAMSAYNCALEAGPGIMPPHSLMRS